MADKGDSPEKHKHSNDDDLSESELAAGTELMVETELLLDGESSEAGRTAQSLNDSTQDEDEDEDDDEEDDDDDDDRPNYRESSSFDEDDLEVITLQTGKNQRHHFVYKKYCYLRNKECGSGAYLRCTSHRSLKCHGSARLDDDAVHTLAPHSHPPCEVTIENLKLRRNCTDACIKEDTPFQEIYEREAAKFPKANITFSGLKTQMQRAKQSFEMLDETGKFSEAFIEKEKMKARKKLLKEEASRLPCTMEIITLQNGKNRRHHYIHNEYCYLRNKDFGGGAYLRCASSRGQKCRGSARLDNDTILPLTPHSHPPCQVLLANLRLRRSCTEAVATDNSNYREIFEREAAKYPKATLHFTGMKAQMKLAKRSFKAGFRSLTPGEAKKRSALSAAEKKLTKVRKQNMPPNPASMVEMAQFLREETGRLFAEDEEEYPFFRFFYNGDDGDFLVFLSEKMRTMLSLNTSHLNISLEGCGDPLFHHLLTVLMATGDRAYPVVFVLMENQSEELYKRVFCHLKETYHWKPSLIISDYDDNLQGALEFTFGKHGAVKGCHYPYCQALLKTARQHVRGRKLTSPYILQFLYQLFGLPLLNPKLLYGALSALRRFGLALAAEDQAIVSSLLQHTEQLWLCKERAIRHSMYRVFVWTNNPANPFHQKMSKEIRNLPSTWDLIDRLQKACRLNYNDYEAFVRSNQGLNPRNKERKEQLEAYWNRMDHELEWSDATYACYLEEGGRLIGRKLIPGDPSNEAPKKKRNRPSSQVPRPQQPPSQPQGTMNNYAEGAFSAHNEAALLCDSILSADPQRLHEASGSRGPFPGSLQPGPAHMNYQANPPPTMMFQNNAARKQPRKTNEREDLVRKLPGANPMHGPSADTSSMAPPEKKAKYLEGEIMNLTCFRTAQSRFDYLSKSWSVELENMTSEQQMIAIKSINDILYEGRLGNLHHDQNPAMNHPSTSGASVAHALTQYDARAYQQPSFMPEQNQSHASQYFPNFM